MVSSLYTLRDLKERIQSHSNFRIIRQELSFPDKVLDDLKANVVELGLKADSTVSVKEVDNGFDVPIMVGLPPNSRHLHINIVSNDTSETLKKKILEADPTLSTETLPLMMYTSPMPEGPTLC